MRLLGVIDASNGAAKERSLFIRNVGFVRNRRIEHLYDRGRFYRRVGVLDRRRGEKRRSSSSVARVSRA